MKKLTIISAVVILIVLITVYFVYELNFDPNRELVFNDLKAMFKPSVPYTLDVDIDDIEYASYSGSFADWEYHRGRFRFNRCFEYIETERYRINCQGV